MLEACILLPGILGEGSPTLRLVAMGVNASKWEERASAAAIS
jgi:hypothetical protein